MVFCKKIKTTWFIDVEVEQEMSAPPPKKNPGSASGGAYFRNFTVTQMLTDTLIRGRRTTYEVNVSGVLFSPFPETKKRQIAGYVRYDVIYHLFPINSQYI